MKKTIPFNIKRILAVFLTLAITFSLFAVPVSADNSDSSQNGQTVPPSSPLGDSSTEETKPENVALGVSGIANRISPFALDFITDLPLNTELDVNTLYNLKDGNWTIRADAYFIQADGVAPILDSVTEIFTNYVKFQNFGHFLIIRNYPGYQVVRTLGPLPVLSPTPDANGLTPWGKEVEWDLKKLLIGDDGKPFPDKSELYIEVRYAKTLNGQVLPDSAGVIINHEYIEPEVTINGGTGTGPVYHPTSIDFVSNRDHGLDIDGRDTTNVWGIEDEAGDLVSGGRWNETTTAWEFAPGFTLATSSFADGDDIISKSVALEDTPAAGTSDIPLPAGTYKAVTSEKSTTKYGNPIPPEVVRDTFALLSPLTAIGGATNDADPTNPGLTTPLTLDPDDLVVTSKNDSTISTSTWILTHPNGTTETGTFTGAQTSHTIPKPSVEGKYKLQIIETMSSEYGSTKHVTTGTFSLGKVTYTYEDRDGNPLIPTAPIPPSIGTTGDPYTVPPAPTIPGYTVVTPLPPVGDYTDGETTVTYVYKKNATLVVKHLFFEEDGITPASTPTQNEPVKNGFVGDPYTTIPLASVPPGYILAPFANSGNVSGQYADGETTVTYSYKKIPTGTLEVNHIFLDEKGNVVTNPATITKNSTEYVGTTYATSALTGTAMPAGYRLVKGRDPANASGKYALTHTVVEYYYEPIIMGTVTVIHTIEHADGSVTVHKTEVPIVDVTDTPYTSTPVKIPGYTLKEVPSNHTGIITATPQTVTYVYVADPALAQLVEKHFLVDANGNIIGEVAPPKITIELDGTKYFTWGRAPAGYELVKSKAPTNPYGVYKTGIEQVVIYYYAPIVPAPPTPPGITVSLGGSGGNYDSGTGGSSSNRPDTGTSYSGAETTQTHTDAPEQGKVSAEKEPTESSDGSDGDSTATNPQTGDTTNRVQLLTTLYVLLAVSVVALVASLVIPKKRKRQR